MTYGKIILFFFLLITLKGTAQQDPIFTQYMYNGQVINPAYAGRWGKVGFTALVRKQWTGIHQSPLIKAISIPSLLVNKRVEMESNIINDSCGREKRLVRLNLKFGFVNYKSPLTDYLLFPDNVYDWAFVEDIDLNFLPNVGVGAFLYEGNYHNYSIKAEVQTIYLTGGYVFQFYALDKIIFKPILMVRATIEAPIEYDLAANFMLKEKLLLGLIIRTGNAVAS